MDDSAHNAGTPFAFRRLLVATEGGSGLRPLTRFALRLAAADARVRLTDVVCNPVTLFPTLMLSYPDWDDAHRIMVYGAHAALCDAAREFGHEGAVPETDLIDLSAGRTNAPDALRHAAAAWGADLVAVSAHPHGHRWACRLDPEEVAAGTHCPVLYVPAQRLADDDLKLDRVLVAVDGSDTSLLALRIALSVAPPQAEVRAIHVVDRALGVPRRWRDAIVDEAARRALKAAVALIEGCGRTVPVGSIDTGETDDDVSRAIAREAKQWQADLIVIGSHGGRGPGHWMAGNVAARSLRDTPCAVLVCPLTSVAHVHAGEAEAEPPAEVPGEAPRAVQPTVFL
ncbi:universal stress protein [Paraburkholderia kururiensis]|uniref:Universal stress protein n=1 Tax=Paraburkholderia kururiensis TaxID=984307 RepID=A0ABZ0WQM4_9BURK|nr:universal stress protein [Paraburkholderia kururiensis]WQD79667.1 universal stress protein [Paraburkholderia kururiensis]